MNSPIFNIAHRGFSKAYPENTKIAFDKAAEVGADGFECDLRLSSDGEVFLFHDDSLERLCEREGRLEDFPSERIREFRVRGEAVPTLEEAVRGLEEFIWNLELKPTDAPEPLAKAVIQRLKQGILRRKPFISSFDLAVLKAIKDLDPHGEWASLGILVETRYLDRLDELTKLLRPQTWNLPKSILASPIAKTADSRPIWIWTLDHQEDWTRAIQLPVQAIITNDPRSLDAFFS